MSEEKIIISLCRLAFFTPLVCLAVVVILAVFLSLYQDYGISGSLGFLAMIGWGLCGFVVWADNHNAS